MNRRLFLISTLFLVACSKKRKKFTRLPNGAKVVALGDSLTVGFGAESSEAFPTLLAEITGWNIKNGGVSGDTSEKALARLPFLLEENPQLVLISIGGNDFLRKIPPADTSKNIEKMLELVKNANSQALLIAEPHISTGALIGILSDSPIYEELAQKHHVPLLVRAWSDVLSDEKLKSDQIHANAAGYRVFTEKLTDFLRREGLL